MTVIFYMMLPLVFPNLFQQQSLIENGVYMLNELEKRNAENINSDRMFIYCGILRSSSSNKLYLVFDDCYYSIRNKSHYTPLDKSVLLYSNQIALDKSNCNALALRSLAYSLLSETKKSHDDLLLLRSIYNDMKPRNDTYDRIIINSYINNNMLEEALEYCNFLLRIDNGNRTAIEELAQIYGLLERMLDATKAAENAVRTSPTLRNKIALISIKAAMHDHSGVILFFKQNKELYHPHFYCTVADAYAAELNYDNSLRYSVMSLMSSIPMSNREAIRTYDSILRSLSHLNRYDDLHSFASYTCRIMPLYHTGYYSSYLYYMHKKNHVNSLKMINRALAIEPGNEFYGFLKSELLICSSNNGIKNVIEANEIADKMLLRNQNSYKAMAIKALLAAEANSWSDALDYVNNAIKECDDPKFTKFLVLIKGKYTIHEKHIIK